MKTKPVETHYRSLVKSVSYRALSIIADYTFAYLFTRNAAFSAGIVLFVNFYSLILYYLHERAWAHIHWGRPKPLLTASSAYSVAFAEKSESVTSQGQADGAVSVTV